MRRRYFRRENILSYILITFVIFVISVTAVPFVVKNIHKDKETEKENLQKAREELYGSNPIYIRLECQYCHLPFYVNGDTVSVGTKLQEICDFCGKTTVYMIGEENK